MLMHEQVEFYRENGYLLVKGLLSREEAAEYRAECHAIAERLEAAGQDIDATWGSARGASGASGAPGGATTAPTRILNAHDVQFHSAHFSRLLADPRLGECAAAVMGTPNVQLHHTKMFIKPPENGSPFPLHQDYPYFPHRNDSMIAAIIHLDDAPLEKGCVRVVPGSYKLGRLPHQQEGGWHLAPAEYPLESSTACPAEAGDALFFSYLTIHGSGLNVSSEPRTTVLVQMRAAEDEPEQMVHLSRGQGMMLHGYNAKASPYAP